MGAIISMKQIDIIARRIAVVVLCLFSVFCLIVIVLLAKIFWPHYVYIYNAVRCVYHYEYNNDNGIRCQDSVELTEEDCRLLVNLIGGKPFREALDLEKGFVPEYSLEFFDKDGNSTMILIQRIRDKCLRINGTIWDYEFRGETKEQLFSTLETYHRHDRVIEAG